MSRRRAAAGLVLAALVTALATGARPGLAGHGDLPPLFRQPLTIASATLTEAELLTGAAGTPVTVGGELRVPVTQARVPAIVLVHGDGGLGPGVRHWADVLNATGLAVLVLDSFNGRGIAETATDPARLAHAAMLVDAYRALAALAQHPRIDGRRVAVMGFAKGGWAALYANVQRFQRMHGRGAAPFAAALAFYPPCTARYAEDDQVVPRPLRVLHGTADDRHPIEGCRAYVARLRAAGADAALVELAGARHQFDVQDLPAVLSLPQISRPTCLTEERARGVMVDAATGRAPVREACVRRGAHIGHDARAYEEAMRQAKETLVAALGGA